MLHHLAPSDYEEEGSGLEDGFPVQRAAPVVNQNRYDKRGRRESSDSSEDSDMYNLGLQPGVSNQRLGSANGLAGNNISPS